LHSPIDKSTVTALNNNQPKQGPPEADAMGKPMITAKIYGLTACLALAAIWSNTPAQAQFMTNYPVIIVPPPPAQNMVMPRPKPAPRAAPPVPAAPPSEAAAPEIQCHLQGQTKVCN
jgi:hypothetical protein